MKWTFNFDAGWGVPGFANSLYDNPKEPGVDEDLSDQWFEGYVKPALSRSYRLASSSERPTARSARSASGPTGRFQPTSGWTSRRSGPRISRSDGGRVTRSTDSARTRSTSSWAGRSTAGSRLPARRRGGRRRQPRRLLDERARGVRARRDRPLQAGRTYSRSVLSRQRRARGERHRQPVVGRELRARSERTRRSAPLT